MNDRSRDTSMERLLREAMSAEIREESAQCLDAETLAAWSDGSLPASDRSAAEGHAAGCARCQAMLATMVRTQPAAAVAQKKSGSPIRKWLMMLGPAVAAATAVALWVSVDRSGPMQVALQKNETPAAATEPLPQASPRAEVAAPREEAERKLDDERAARVPRSDESKLRTVEADKRGQYRANGARDAVAALKPAAPPPPAPVTPNESQTVAVGTPPVAVAPGSRAAEGPPPSPPTALTGALQQAAQSQAANSQNAQAPNQQNVQTRADAPAPDQRAFADQVILIPRAAAGAAGRGQVADSRNRVGLDRNESAPFELVSPDASVRWRILSGRIVQRSTDTGATWATQFTAADDVRLTAGVSPSATVCWIVGRSGIVLRSTDGRSWQRVPFPEAVDLTKVTATDARTATVIAADGRTFQVK
jgi:hypothetical protein